MRTYIIVYGLILMRLNQSIESFFHNIRIGGLSSKIVYGYIEVIISKLSRISQNSFF